MSKNSRINYLELPVNVEWEGLYIKWGLFEDVLIFIYFRRQLIAFLVLVVTISLLLENSFLKFFYCTIEKKTEILILKKKDLENILIITIHLYRFLFHTVHLRALFHFLSQWRTLAISKIFKIGNELLAWSLQSHSSRVGNWFPFCLRNKVSFWFFSMPCWPFEHMSLVLI